ncbi:helix-turn-helix domain-containing protein [Salinarchaeum sp. IM2453]|uniref:helix-turn-helix domain-containing protein n=1 Tax=Salinarchaeum sp. IM2453 TaxID=2862870 RepID=UPI001C8360FC|nr:helix-turn-helix domain-containing protein [Salinarchaeum sp. IM2453]QZA89546.1 helix-turn-helix domain-containing protein [Salinarchaeum sp. IM2453]
MRPRVPWMNETDDAILEFYQELEQAGFRIALPPTAVWVNITQELGMLDKARNTVSRRMKKLNEMGLLEITDEKRRYYRITDKGIAYLEGELEYDDLVLPEDS